MDITDERQDIIDKSFIDVTAYLSIACPNMLTFYNLFRKKSNPDIETIRINVQDDCFPILEYNPGWIVSVKDENPYFVTYAVYMEMLKFILHHTTTRALSGYTPVASSVIVNCAEARAVFDHMARKEREEQLNVLDAVPSRAWLEKRIAGWVKDDDFYLEKVEALIREKIPDIFPDEDKRNKKDKQGPSGFGEAYGKSGGEQVPDKEDDGTGDSNNGAGKPSGGGQDEQKKSEDLFSKKSMKESTEKWGESEIMDELIKQTFGNCPASGWGNISSEMVSFFTVANKRKVNVKEILAKFRQSVFSATTTTTRMRPNRRHGMSIPGLRHEHKSKILLAVDVSGSMTKDDIEKSLSTMDSYLRGAVVDYCFWDTNCTAPTSLGKNGFRIGENVRTEISGGGTRPSCIGDYLRDHRMAYDGLVMFTDCIWRWEEKNFPGEIAIINTSSADVMNISYVPEFVRYKVNLDDMIGRRK